jgi:hypothetical protein
MALAIAASACEPSPVADPKTTTELEDRLESLDGVDGVDVRLPQDDDRLHATTVTVTMAGGATESDYVAALEELQQYAEEEPELFAGMVAHPGTTPDDFVGVEFIGDVPEESSPAQQVGWLFRGLELWPDARTSVGDGLYLVEFDGPDEVGPAIRAMTEDPVLSEVDSGYLGFVPDRRHTYGVGINAGFDEDVATVWEGAVAALRPLGVSSNTLYMSLTGVADEARWLVNICTDLPDGPAPVAQHRHDLVPAVGQLLDLLASRDARLDIGGCGRRGRTIVSLEASDGSASLRGPADWAEWAAAHLTSLGIEVETAS